METGARLSATFFLVVAFTSVTTNHGVRSVFSCDYNGWADVPEEEREGIDAFESAAQSTPAGKVDASLSVWQPRVSFHEAPIRRAA